MRSGKIIVIDGPDGSGKNTACTLTHKLLQERQPFDKSFHTTSFPNYNRYFGKLIRGYLDGDKAEGPLHVPEDIRNDPTQASLLYAADRRDTYLTTMKPRLDQGDVYLLDRYISSNMCHQAAKLPLEERDGFLHRLLMMENVYLELPPPNKTFILYVPEDIRSRRVKARLQQTNSAGGQVSAYDIHEQNLVYMAEVAREYQRQAAACGWEIVDCVPDGKELSPEEISELLYEKIVMFLNETLI